jgi:Ca-activated chloride channel family protein
MSFYSPHAFWLLVIPVLCWGLDLRRRRVAAAAVAHPKIRRANAGVGQLELASPSAGSEKSTTPASRVRWRLWLGLACAVVAFARPQWGRVDEPVFDQAREILIALDLSRSMLTPDVKPSRLSRGKLLVTSLLERLQGERVGLVVFAGTAFLQSPLSSDYEILNEFLPELDPDFLPEGGTNYKSLIETALSAFSASSSADRFLIVLSDGEATDENWKASAAELKERGIRVIGLGVGTPEGALVPDGKGGYVKDERGAVVLSKLEPATLQQLAELTQGTYRDASSWVDLAQLVQSTVDAGKKGAFQEKRQVRLVERFQWVLGPALLFFLWSFWREFPVHPRSRDLRLAGRSSAPPPLPATGRNIRPGSEGAATALLLGLLLFASALPARAAVTNTSAAEPLSALVGQLSSRPKLNARDYSELAQSTLTYAERMKAARENVVEGPIHDGLAAVDAGEALDPKAADWEKLRAQLNEYLKKEPPPQPKPDEQKRDKDQDKKDEQKKDQEQKDGQKKSDNQDSKDQESGQKPQEKPDSKEGDSKPQDQKSDQKDSSPEDKSPDSKQDQKPENKDPQKSQSAFGDMQKEPKPTPAPQAQPPQQPPGGSPETQKVGGTPDKPVQQPPDNPELVVPLQKLEQVRNQDSPVRLQQLMRGEKQTPANAGKNW